MKVQKDVITPADTTYTCDVYSVNRQSQNSQIDDVIRNGYTTNKNHQKMMLCLAFLTFSYVCAGYVLSQMSWHESASSVTVSKKSAA